MSDTNTKDAGPPPEGGFTDWLPLTAEGVARAPDRPAAVQLCTRNRRLVLYPTGKSAMVFYFYAARSAREALLRVFADEIEAPGARGEGPLAFRTLAGDDARARLERLYDEFCERFGAAPVLHALAPDAASDLAADPTNRSGV